MAKAVVEVKAVPPVAVAYHWMVFPAAIKLATVGLVLAQNVCAEAVGAGVIGLTVTLTVVRVLSQPLTVCEA